MWWVMVVVGDGFGCRDFFREGDFGKTLLTPPPLAHKKKPIT